MICCVTIIAFMIVTITFTCLNLLILHRYLHVWLDSILAWLSVNPVSGGLAFISVFVVGSLCFFPVALLTLGAGYAYADTTHFVFEDGRIKLRHLQMNGGPVIVDQCQCMAFLTAGADPFAMREDHIIKKEWPLLKKMTEATNVVDIYDSSTWDGIDFEPILDIVYQFIGARWGMKPKNAPHLAPEVSTWE